MSFVSRVVDTEVGGSTDGLDASRSIVICRLAAIRRSRVLPAYTANLGLAVAAVHVLAGVGFARTGAFSPDGIALLGAPVFAVWMAVVGVALLRRGPEFVPARSDA